MSKIESLFREWKRLLPITEERKQRLDKKFKLEFNYNSNHIEGNTLTYGQTELLLLFGKVAETANMKDLEEMKASNVGLKMMEEEVDAHQPLTETFIRQLHSTLLREDYTVYRNLPNSQTTSYTVHAGTYKTRPNSVITPTGERFEYASPEETPALMYDLTNWYRKEEENNVLTPIELASLFHYRYIRIHPFEDGNGRMARLLVNYILRKHGYPMIVVKSADKEKYLNALNLCDSVVGSEPSAGAHASLDQIRPFVTYMESCLEQALQICIKAAKGLSIEEDDDFMKELKLLELQKKQEIATEESKRKFSAEEVWNVLEFVFLPLVESFEATREAVGNVFRFQKQSALCGISKSQDLTNVLGVWKVQRNTNNSQLIDYVSHAKSAWYYCKMLTPMNPSMQPIIIEKDFHITFFDDHYFIDGILNKNFLYGTYPSEEEKKTVVSQFKQDILSELKEKL